MDILPSSSSFGNIKRYWRRRKYTRLDEDNKKQVKMTKLGSKKRKVWKIRRVPKLRLKMMVVSPIKLLAKFHDAYINMMIGLVGSSSNDNNVIGGVFGVKRVPKGRPVPVLSATTDEIVDGRIVMEIYKRLVMSTRQSAP